MFENVVQTHLFGNGGGRGSNGGSGGAVAAVVLRRGSIRRSDRCGGGGGAELGAPFFAVVEVGHRDAADAKMSMERMEKREMEWELSVGRWKVKNGEMEWAKSVCKFECVRKWENNLEEEGN
jgi:hypothetical protein